MDFKDKKIAVLGFGAEGMSSARYFAGKGASVTVHDLKELSDLDEVKVEEAKSLGVEFKVGTEYLKK